MFCANWPAPENVKSLITTRKGGVSAQHYSSLNLAKHVGDQTDAVTSNRALLENKVGLPIFFPKQIHSADILNLSSHHPCELTSDVSVADGVYSCEAREVCAVQTADCLPILLCDTQGYEVASIHAGWRGLACGILANTLEKFVAHKKNILIYLGPAISGRHFEVGDEVIQAFNASAHQRDWNMMWKQDSVRISRHQPNKYYLDLYKLAIYESLACAVPRRNIYGGQHCTFNESHLFYSYRRDGICGRMASLVWRTS